MENEKITVETLMKRGYLYLEDHDWENAKLYFDKSLDADPENSKAYVGMLLSELHIDREEMIVQSPISFAENVNYQKALRFAEEGYKPILEKYNFENILYRGEAIAQNATTEKDFLQAVKIFESAGNYKNALERAGTMRQQLSELEKRKANKRQKRIKAIGIIACFIFAVLICGVVLRINSNSKLADEIYKDLLGRTFHNLIIDNDSYKTRHECWITFNGDGTVKMRYKYDREGRLTYPKVEERHHDYEEAYNSFSVDVDFSGEVYVLIENRRCRIFLDKEGKPNTIYDFVFGNELY